MAPPKNITSAFVPKTTPALIDWSIIFNKMLPEFGPLCQVSAEQISENQADTAHLVHFMQVVVPAVQAYEKGIKNYIAHLLRGTKESQMAVPVAPTFPDAPPARPPGLMERIVALGNQIKHSPGYTENIGRELGLLSIAVTAPHHDLPTFTLTTRRGPERMLVIIPFKKYGHTAVSIDCRINGGEWEENIAINDSSPHIDDRPLRTPGVPEIRGYRLRFWDKGTAHGEWTEPQHISVTP